MGFVRKDKENSGKMKIRDFKIVLKSIIKNISDDTEVHQKIIDFVRVDEGSTDDDSISFEKLNTLIEVYQFYPLIVKKDKNQSTSIY